ncbi:hypothetical protein XELAEV_18004001mg [Xenopus laevis]|uniref:Uncharacterized protein n=1 Tax=Xenopus laevis TaxID=8355 RepID=A0A974BN05_XENLA|nr:hypothetical protein XELAEV_18004001mg [Xenopus laevis]
MLKSCVRVEGTKVKPFASTAVSISVSWWLDRFIIACSWSPVRHSVEVCPDLFLWPCLRPPRRCLFLARYLPVFP